MVRLLVRLQRGNGINSSAVSTFVRKFARYRGNGSLMIRLHGGNGTSDGTSSGTSNSTSTEGEWYV